MLQYMANAIPVVVSYAPTNAEIVDDGINGFLVNSQTDWVSKLFSLIENGGIEGE